MGSREHRETLLMMVSNTGGVKTTLDMRYLQIGHNHSGKLVGMAGLL